jgi:hypothetical protein
MMAVEEGDAGHPGSRREPIAITNLAWVLGLGATLCALGKVLSVSGLSPDVAMLVLRSTNILQVVTGVVLSDLQFLSVVIWLYILALYLPAEWPRHGRHEREFHVLGALLAVSTVVVVAIGPWQAGSLLLVAGLSVVVAPLIHRLAAHGALGRRAKKEVRERILRDEFRRSLPAAVIGPIRTGDVPAALAALTNAPGFAAEELEYLAQVYDPSTGVRRIQVRVARVAIFLACVGLFAAVASPRPWVGAERLQFGNGVTRIGYVLGATEGDNLLVKWTDNGQVEIVTLDEVKSRALCQRVKPYPTLLTIVGIVRTTTYTAC